MYVNHSKYSSSALLTTSTRWDIERSNGKVSVAGLDAIKVSNILSLQHIVPQAEVVQVLTIGGTTDPTVAASQTYKIIVDLPGAQRESGSPATREYVYTAPATLTGTAATDRQNMYDKLASDINADSGVYITAAAGTGGTAMTLTDDTGYYGTGTNRGGASSVSLWSSDDSLTTATHLETTTAAVYAYGIGADLIAAAATLGRDGNLTQYTEYGVPSGAVSGQLYAGFVVNALVDSGELPTIGKHFGYTRASQLVYVDNGAGTSTSNATGYADFLREFEKMMFAPYWEDPTSMISFFEANHVITTGDSGLGYGDPTGTGGDENLIDIPDPATGRVTRFKHHVLGTQTILAPNWTTAGLDIVQDAGDNDGAEYAPHLEAACPQEFRVGEQPFSFRTEFSIADVSDTDDCAMGLRKKEAFQANIDDYDEMAALNVISGDIYIETILNGAATSSTDTTQNWADGETHVLEIKVDIDGKCRFFVDDSEVTSVLSADFSFDSGEEVIPFFYHINAGANDPGTTLKKWFAIPGEYKRILDQ